ncbi:MAG: copper homeostasis protein CutC [Bacteroidetes bacterium]|nr:copper homeostasis protein CutC [Bacteroidota bacterium]
MPLLEIAVFSEYAAMLAASSGAHRLELCNDYSTGGVSMPADTLRRLRTLLPLPCFVMVRPRPGDFVYTESEIRTMETYIKEVRDLRYEGFVFGCLTPKGETDTDATARLIQAAGGLQCTFHRAFDECPDPGTALEVLKDLGIARILTARSADWLRLRDHSGGKPLILPGGGLRSNNMKPWVEAGFPEFHSSAILSPAAPDFLPDSDEIRRMLALCV